MRRQSMDEEEVQHIFDRGAEFGDEGFPPRITLNRPVSLTSSVAYHTLRGKARCAALGRVVALIERYYITNRDDVCDWACPQADDPDKPHRCKAHSIIGDLQARGVISPYFLALGPAVCLGEEGKHIGIYKLNSPPWVPVEPPRCTCDKCPTHGDWVKTKIPLNVLCITPNCPECMRLAAREAKNGNSDPS